MRTILVTGHSKGIGLAITKALLKNGHRVVGVSRTDIEARDGLVQHVCDLSRAKDVEKISKELKRSSQTTSTATDSTNPNTHSQKPNTNSHLIDAVICNAGAGHFGALENFSADQIQENIQLNLISPLILLKALLPGLKQHARSNIVFIASESALQGGRYGSVYSAAKFGLRGAAQSLRYECAAANCHVGIVNPGMVRTGFFDTLDFEPGNAKQHALCAEDVARAAISMLNAPDNAVIEEINVSPLQHVVQKKRD